MVAAFSQLHQNIQQSQFVRLSCPIYYVNIFHQYICVPVKRKIRLAYIHSSTFILATNLMGTRDCKPMTMLRWLPKSIFAAVYVKYIKRIKECQKNK